MGKKHSTCEFGLHSRVYDHSRIMAGNPPKKAWICEICGAQGIETVGPRWEKESHYDRVKKGFEQREQDDG